MKFSESVKLEVKKKAHYRCIICNSFGPLHIHHITPLHEGGSDDIDNAVALCPTCHDNYGDNPKKRKWIKEKRNFWYDHCEKILNYDNLNQLEMTYDLLEEFIVKKDEKILNLEKKIEILNKTIQHYSTVTNNLITRLPYSNVAEKQLLREQISISSNTLAVSGAMIDSFSRKERGTYYRPSGAFFKPSDSLEKMFGLKLKRKKAN